MSYTYCTLPTISNNFSWMTCTTSKLEQTQGQHISSNLYSLSNELWQTGVQCCVIRTVKEYLLFDVTE